MKKRIYLLLGLCAVLAAFGCSNDDEAEQQGKAIDGYWEGAIEVPEQAIPIAVEFDGGTGKLSIPSQGVKDYPLSTVKYNDPEVAFDVTLQGQRLLFEGGAASGEITGTFTQQGQKFPFALKPGTKPAAPDPEQLAETEVEGGTMKGLVEMPDTEGPHPVAVIIAGSGPTDKDGNSVGFPGTNDSLKMLAEDLAEEGIASVRYDKRGIGDNAAIGKAEQDLRIEDFMADAEAWVQFAKEDGRFTDVAVIGHSEGALIGLVAAQSAQADRYVSLTGVGRPSGELLREQLRTLPEGQQIEAERILGELEAGRIVEEVSPELQQIFRPAIQAYLQSWMAYDPVQESAKLEASALYIGGTRDLQVPAADSERLHEANPGNSELLIIEDMNHVLKKVGDNAEENQAAYADPDFPLAPGLTDGIAAFLTE